MLPTRGLEQPRERNTCFMNSGLQILAQVQDVIKEIENHCHAANVSQLDCFFCVLITTLCELTDPKIKVPFIPRSLINIVNLQGRALGIQSGIQGDASEFLRFVVDKGGLQSFSFITSTREQCSLCQTLVKFDAVPSHELRIGVLENNEERSLQACVNRFFTPTRSGGFCAECMGPLQEVNSIGVLPQNLLVVLDRAHHDGHRIMSRITPTNRIYLTQGSDQESPSTKRYELVGLIEHSSQMVSSGHYYAVIRNGDEWVKKDDNRQKIISQPNSSFVTVLLYKLTEPSVQGPLPPTSTEYLLPETNNSDKGDSPVIGTESQDDHPPSSSCTSSSSNGRTTNLEDVEDENSTTEDEYVPIEIPISLTEKRKVAARKKKTDEDNDPSYEPSPKTAPSSKQKKSTKRKKKFVVTVPHNHNGEEDDDGSSNDYSSSSIGDAERKRIELIWKDQYATQIYSRCLNQKKLLVFCIPLQGQTNQKFEHLFRTTMSKKQRKILYTITYSNSPFYERLIRDPKIKDEYIVFSEELLVKFGCFDAATAWFAEMVAAYIIHSQIHKDTFPFEFIFDNNPSCLVTSGVLRYWKQMQQKIIESVPELLERDFLFCKGRCKTTCSLLNFHRSVGAMKRVTFPEDSFEESCIDTSFRFVNRPKDFEGHPIEDLLCIGNQLSPDEIKSKFSLTLYLKRLQFTLKGPFHVYILTVLDTIEEDLQKDSVYGLWEDGTGDFAFYVGMTKNGRYRAEHLRKSGGTSVSDYITENSTVYLTNSVEINDYIEATKIEAQQIAIFNLHSDKQKKDGMGRNFQLLNKVLPGVPLYEAGNEKDTPYMNFFNTDLFPVRFFRNGYVKDECESKFFQQFYIGEPIMERDLRSVIQTGELNEDVHGTDNLESISSSRLNKERGFTNSQTQKMRQRRFLCSTCGMTFAHRYRLKSHELRHEGIRRFLCTTCKRRFFTKSELRGHIKMHSDLRPFKCSTCKKAFKKHSALKSHNMIHTGERPYKCELCELTFRSSNSRSRHVIKMHLSKTKVFKCTTCGRTYSRQCDLTLHNKIHKDIGPLFKCRICGNTFPVEAHLKIHMKALHTNRSNIHETIDVCNTTLHNVNKSVASTSQKIRTRSDRSRPFKCEFLNCGYTFVRKESLRRHTLLHNSPRHFKCTVCGNTYNWQTNLERHLKTHNKNYSLIKGTDFTSDVHQSVDMYHDHIPNSENFQKTKTNDKRKRDFGCTTCGKNFLKKWHLQAHLRIHSDAKPYKCNICDFKTKHPHNLNFHIRQHEELQKPSTSQHTKKSSLNINKTTSVSQNPTNTEFPRHRKFANKFQDKDRYNCIFCNEEFIIYRELKYHMASHIGRGPFKCPACSKTFSRTGDFNRHIQTHTGARPFRCSKCPKNYLKKDHLETHMKVIHAGERSFKCKKCNATFGYASALKTHMLQHTDVRKFKCKSCGQSFKRQHHLSSHLTTHKKGLWGTPSPTTPT